jgi:hypothetical protein
VQRNGAKGLHPFETPLFSMALSRTRFIAGVFNKSFGGTENKPDFSQLCVNASDI